MNNPQIDFFNFQNFYLVGIKGVAMTSLAQCLIDMDKTVRGSDVAEDFVTKDLLLALPIKIDAEFMNELPSEMDCLIYTSAHGGPDNPQVLQALKRQIPIFSQAEAISLLANTKKGLAVCGVGGKSTTSAMITWILTKTGHDPSFSVGVGNIPGLNRTGRWNDNSDYFVVEADEYVVDTQAISKNQPIVPRFSFLHPFVTVCTNLAFDHPDVYRNFDETKKAYYAFFSQLKHGGFFIYNELNKSDLPNDLINSGTSFGESTTANFSYLYSPELSQAGKSIATINYKNRSFQLTLQIPGKYNIQNAVAAIAAVNKIGIEIQDAISALGDFKSTMRRFELVGTKHGITYYDDYAHHPNELKAAIQALSDWYSNARKIICFQSHTFSRTKQLFEDFVEALSSANEVYLIDIFASARESHDATISSDMLVTAVKQKNPDCKIENVYTIHNLATTIQQRAQSGDVVLTLGAGDIYKVHDLIQND